MMTWGKPGLLPIYSVSFPPPCVVPVASTGLCGASWACSLSWPGAVMSGQRGGEGSGVGVMSMLKLRRGQAGLGGHNYDGHLKRFPILEKERKFNQKLGSLTLVL